MNNKTISILGCGWLGMPLAQRLVKENWDVKGSTTSINKIELLRNNSIEPYLINLAPGAQTTDIESFLDSKILIIDIPPKRNETVLEVFSEQIKSLINEINKSLVERVIFISSTSVYGSNNDVITEQSELNPETESGKALVIAEGLLRAESTFSTTILRFSGLIGPDRHPGKFLAGRTNIDGGTSRINLIHLDDCVEIILRIIEMNIWNEIFNAAADEHPTKMEFYTAASKNLGIAPPTFSDTPAAYKVISSVKFKNFLNYKFIHPNPMEMF